MAVTVNTGSPGNSASIVNFYSGGLTSDAVAAVDFVLNIGFQARYVKLLNITDLATQEFFDGMPSGNCLQEIAAGTKSLVASGIVVDRNNVTLKAALVPLSKSFYIVAYA